jgi:hypothetical protein
MRTGRAIIISAFLALGMAGPVLAISTVSATAGQAPVVHVQAASTYLLYHG